MRVAIYARVSTKDKGQDTENQIVNLRAYAKAMKWEVSEEYIDNVSGSGLKERTAFDRMMRDASRAQFDFVLVWALDRFTREGVSQTFEYIKKLLSYRVQFVSYTEEHFRTTGPAGELMIAIAAWIANQERKRISERTIAGLKRVSAAGVKLGRRRRMSAEDGRIRAMHEAGMSVRQIVRALAEDGTTVSRGVVGKEITRLRKGLGTARGEAEGRVFCAEVVPLNPAHTKQAFQP